MFNRCQISLTIWSMSAGLSCSIQLVATMKRYLLIPGVRLQLIISRRWWQQTTMDKIYIHQYFWPSAHYQKSSKSRLGRCIRELVSVINWCLDFDGNSAWLEEKGCGVTSQDWKEDLRKLIRHGSWKDYIHYVQFFRSIEYHRLIWWLGLRKNNLLRE